MESNTQTHAHKKNRCAFENCNARVVKIIGDCRYCNQKFCGTHRLPETHLCPNLDTCRQASFDKNSHKLLSEKCVKLKV